MNKQQYNKEYYQKHKDRLKNKDKENYKEKRAKRLQKVKEYYIKNRKRILLRKKMIRRGNKTAAPACKRI